MTAGGPFFATDVAATGASVSAGDFELKNWDPLVNYTADQYLTR